MPMPHPTATSPPTDLLQPAPALAPRLGATTVVAALLVVGVLYLGREVFVPFALAVLLGFILDPLVTRLRRLGLPRAVAVVAVMLATVAVLGATTLFVGAQVVQLSKDLPSYQQTIRGKLRGLRQAASGRGLLDEASRMLNVVDGELDAARRDMALASRRAGADAGNGPAAASSAAPLRVQVEPPRRNALQTIADIVEPVLAPLGTAGIVLVFTIFMLLERNDLRDRLLRLAGGDLHRSTDALGEAGDRVSAYLTMQLLVNLSYGVPMAAGLALIGVPGALLWGLLAAMLRFVPYIGPVITAGFTLTLAFAVDPGWTLLLWTLALVLTLELVINNIVEPWLYGASTGLSAVSIIVAAVFWTALWGPIGLILATPMTVCLAVLGRHLPALAWLDVLLGSSPAFDAPTRLYQRLLAGDVEEAIELAAEQISQPPPLATAATAATATTSPQPHPPPPTATAALAAFYNDTALPALRLAAQAHSPAPQPAHRHRVITGMAALLRELRDDHPAPADSGSTDDTGAPQVLCAGARAELDTLAADMVGHALAGQGLANRVLPAGAVSAEQIQALDLDGVRVLCLSSFSRTPEALLRYTTRRLRRRQPGLRIVAALWQAPAALRGADAAQALGVDAVATSVADALRWVQALHGDPSAGPDPVPDRLHASVQALLPAAAPAALPASPSSHHAAA